MGCWTPGKVGYETEEKLLKNLCRFPELYGFETYLCRCGLWHLTKKGKRHTNPTDLHKRH